MVDSSTAGAARRPSFICRAARPRLVDRRPRVDRPTSAATACWAAHLSGPSLSLPPGTIPFDEYVAERLPSQTWLPREPRPRRKSPLQLDSQGSLPLRQRDRGHFLAWGNAWRFVRFLAKSCSTCRLGLRCGCRSPEPLELALRALSTTATLVPLSEYPADLLWWMSTTARPKVRWSGVLHQNGSPSPAPSASDPSCPPTPGESAAAIVADRFRRAFAQGQAIVPD